MRSIPEDICIVFGLALFLWGLVIGACWVAINRTQDESDESLRRGEAIAHEVSLRLNAMDASLHGVGEQ